MMYRSTFLGFLLFLTTLLQAADSKEKVYKLWYDRPAPNNGAVFEENWSDRPTDTDWERYSLPIGNGYIGASIFGRTDTERILLSDKTLHIKGLWGTETNTAFTTMCFTKPGRRPKGSIQKNGRHTVP